MRRIVFKDTGTALRLVFVLHLSFLNKSLENGFVQIILFDNYLIFGYSFVSLVSYHVILNEF